MISEKQKDIEVEPIFPYYIKSIAREFLEALTIGLVFLNAADFGITTIAQKSNSFSKQYIEDSLGRNGEKSKLFTISNYLGKPGRELSYLIFDKSPEKIK